MTEYSVRIGEELGLSSQEIENIRIAAVLHDIGKIGINQEILNKKQTLQKDEIEHIHRHPLIASQILGPIDDLKEVIRLIKYHHERFDGTGYPEGLSGKNIPLGSAILAVADAFDAMTSPRPYREAMAPEQALSEMKAQAGTQFDPDVVNAFLKLTK